MPEESERRQRARRSFRSGSGSDAVISATTPEEAAAQATFDPGVRPLPATRAG
jgi:hypothetical protein